MLRASLGDLKTTAIHLSIEPDEQWLDETQKFARLAKSLWAWLGPAFAQSDIHPLPQDGDVLNPVVDRASWPDEQPGASDGDASLASAWVRELARRAYSLDGRSLSTGTSETVFALEDLRHPMAQLIQSWHVRLLNAAHAPFESWLKGHLGAIHVRTLKLLWYVDEAFADHIHNESPDFGPYVSVRRILVEAALEAPSNRPLLQTPKKR